MDKLCIRALRAETIIGCLDWERAVKQTVFFDLEIGYDCRKAGQSDSLDDTLNYAKIAEIVVDFAEKSCFHLLEALAENTVKLLINTFSLSHICVTVSKPSAIANAQSATITITRNQTNLS